MAIYPRAESDRHVESGALLALVGAIFQRCGMEKSDAALLAETLVHSDRRGVHSHGVLRVPDYVRKLIEDDVDPKGRPHLIRQRGGALRIDGGNSMGQIGGTFAMDHAIAAAREHGIAFAALDSSNHCGALDWYTMRAARETMIGIAGTNALPTMAPLGGIEKIVGINPLSVAMPGDGGAGFVLDFAFGATAHGKIRVYHQKGAEIPEGWAYDTAGNPTRDAAKALEGLIQPIGLHKGVGLAMAVGLLSTLLSNASYGTELGNMSQGPVAGGDGQFFIAIDISAFVEPAVFCRRLAEIADEVHGSTRRAGVDRLFMPGEIESDFEAEYEKSGILLASETVDDIAAVAARFDIDAAALFPA